MSRVTDSRSPTNGRELLGKRERDADQGNRRERESSGSNAATTKRPRLALGLGGGNRLFGLVNSTLNKAKVENEKKGKGEAAKQRADLEARLQKTTQKAPSAYSITPSIPSHILKNRTRLEEELRRDTIALQALVDRILTEENVHKSLKTQKRRLASFLVTKAPKDVGVRGRVIAPYVPGAIVPSPKSTSDPNSSSTRDSPTRISVKDKEEDDSELKEKEISTKLTIPDPSTYALYFLPKKLTPSQEDLLDEQEDKCDAELDRMDSQVERKVNDLKNNLERIKNRVKGKKKELEEIRKMEKDIKDREKEKRLKEEAERIKERDERKDGDEAKVGDEDGGKRLDRDEEMESKEVRDQDDKDKDQSRSKSGSRSRSLSRDSKREGSLDREGYAEVN